MRSLTYTLKKQILRTAFAAAFFLFSFPPAFSQMSGDTYIINPSGGGFPNFKSFSEAFDSLESQGVSGPVTINVASNSYEVHDILHSIPGASPTDTIVFRSSTGDSTDVNLFYTYTGTSSENYMIMLDSTDYVTFKSMSFDATGGSTSYGRVFVLKNGANNNKFLNNVFYGKQSSYYNNRTLIYSETRDEYNVFEKNVFYSGEGAIALIGVASGDSKGTIIRYNSFKDQDNISVYLRYHEAPVINDNIISISLSTDDIGIKLESTDKNFQVVGNKIEMNNAHSGIYLLNCNGLAGAKALIANNFIGILGTGSENNGIRADNCNYIQVYHNSIYNSGGWNETSHGFYQYSGGGNIDIKNNIFANFTGGYAYFLYNSSSTLTSDYNNYYTNGNFLAGYGNTNKTDLAALAGAHTGDKNSLSAHPVFTSVNDLHTTTFRLDGKGTDLTSIVPQDIDGETRSTSPDIGADEFTSTGTALSGSYSIGPGQVYTTISGAVDQLNKYGISSSVTFNILDDGSPYNEQFTVLPVTGSDGSNTVTLQPDPGNTGDVEISYSASSDEHYTVQLFRASWVIIKNLTITANNSSYPVAIRINGYSTNDSITGCTINSLGTVSGTAAIFSLEDVLDNIYITGNLINDGRYGVHIDGKDNYYSTGIIITDNQLESHYSGGIYLRNCTAPVVNRNVINSDVSTYYYSGIYFYYCNDNYQIIGNKVLNNDGDGGITVENCTGSSGKIGSIINNLVFIDGTAEGHGISTLSSGYVNVYFNSVKIGNSNQGTNSNAYRNSNGNNIKVLNNIFCNFGPGRAYYNNKASGAIEISNYNCLFTGGKYIGYWGSSEKSILADFQASNLLDGSSLVANPAFQGTDNMHTNSYFLDGAGVQITGITSDFDDDLRAIPPDIGADEFTSSLTPLSGIYKIGGSSPDYATIKGALNDLQIRGVNGPVTFNIRNGNYNEFIGIIYKIPGADKTDTIVLKSESGNPEDVTIFYSTNDITGSIFELNNVDYFSIRDLTISVTGTSYGRPIAVNGTCKDVKIINNILVSANTGWSNLWIANCITDSILIKDNKLTKGTNGIYFIGDQSIRSTNTRIIGNSLSGQSSRGMDLEYHNEPKVINNSIKNTTASSFKGIYMNYCYSSLEISGNTITSNNTQYGIEMYNCEAVDPFYGLITNNMIQIGGTSYATGIYLNNSDRIFLYHNSVNISSTSTDYGYALYTASNNTEIEVVNNILANTGNGRAMIIEDGNDITNSDYNNFYSENPSRFIRYGGVDQANLAAYRTASGKDSHSLSVDPLFYSTTDLRSEQVALFQAATPLADVPYDIDSVARTPGNPDIGAFEFTCGTPEWNVVVSPTCLGDSTTYIDLSTNIARGSTFSWDFDGDYEPDYISNNANDTVMFYFEEAGAYTTYLQITQIAGCNDYTTINVTVSDLPSLDITTKGAYCGEDDGEASVEVTGGTAPYDYFWSTGGTDTLITGLPLGTYTLAVNDANGCTKTEEFTIEEAVQVEVTQIKPSTCGIPDGSAVVIATGGVEPYSYVWSNGETSDTNYTLSTGKHYVNVIDANDCYAQGYINIESDGSGPQVELENVTNNLCYGDKNGAIDISVSGGVEPYSILWSNGETTEDIDNLASGIYDVLVTAADGCLGAGSFQVTQPSKISISTVVEDASCAGSDGKAVAVVSGGTAPYAYSWSSGGIYQIEEGLAAGVYSITVTDGRGCQEVKPVIVNNVGGPVVAIDNITGASCSNPTDGAIEVGVTGGTPLYLFLWSPGGQTTADISDLSPGTYQIKVTDQAGCIGVNTAEVEQAEPAVNPICLVTVDTLTGKNMVVWEKLTTTDVDYYVIYRETNLKGVYQPIGIRPVDSLSIFIDTLADPTIRSWRYKLSVVDECGVESGLSEHHKTMHLTINVGLDDKINLIWDHYEGFDVTTYDVWRYSASGGWEKIQSMPANLTSYTDVNPPSEDLTYYIEVLKPDPCTATENKASTLNSSKSNRQSRLKGSAGNQSPTDISLDHSSIDENEPAGTLVGRCTTTDPDAGDTHTYSLVTGTGSQDNGSFTLKGDSLLTGEFFDFETKSTYSIRIKTTDNGEGNLSFEKTFNISVNDVTEVGLDQKTYQEVRIYPNPFTDRVTIEFPNPENNKYSLKIMDLSGKMVRIADNIRNSQYILERNGLENGYYLLELKGDKLYRSKIVVE